MIDIKELRRLVQAALSKMNARDPEFASSVTPLAVLELLDRLEAAESECLEQARLNGMGSEREAALMAKLEAAEKDIAVKEEVIDSLAAVVKRLDAQCDAAERERDECNRRRLEAADHFAAQTALIKKKYDDLRAKVAEMERQDPVGKFVQHPSNGLWEQDGYGDNPDANPLYALPGAQAQPASSIPVEAIGKMLADVMAVAVSNGANSVSMPDEYVEVAVWLQGECPTQPAPSVPEGWKLVPIEPTPTMVKAGLESSHALNVHRVLVCYDAMIDAAPEAKP